MRLDLSGAALTGLRDLTGGPGAVTLNTPVRYEAVEGDAAPGGDALDADQVERLRTIQMMLFLRFCICSTGE